MDYNNCRLISFPKNCDPNGELTVMEAQKEIPFEIKRTYFIHNILTTCTRGAHAHKTNQQIVVAISGKFEIIVDDGCEKKTYLLSAPHQGLYMGAMLWHELKYFSDDAICLVLASHFYDESDYIRNYCQFLDSLKT